VSVQSIITDVISAPLKMLGGSLIGTAISTLAEHLLWSVGVHGTAITGSIMEPIWLILTDENRQAFQAGLEMPHIITNEFSAIFVNFGGSGGLLALVLLLAFRSRSSQCKTTGKLGLGASFFNISEPIMFGVPIVLNPLLIIPFIIVPFVSVLVTYMAMLSGIVHPPIGIAVPWTTPIFISGYLTTGSIMGSLLQLVNLVIAMLIYYPFFRKWDSICLEKEQVS
jgi:PTS system cellobiose-specific IIC component